MRFFATSVTVRSTPANATRGIMGAIEGRCCGGGSFASKKNSRFDAAMEDIQDRWGVLVLLSADHSCHSVGARDSSQANIIVRT